MIEASSSWPTPRAPVADLEELTSNAHADLLALRGAHIFITGGTGYIGRWLLESLCYANRVLNLNVKAMVLSRRPARFAERYPHLAGDSAITLIRGDVRDFIGEPGEFSHLIHAATDVVATSAPLDVFDVTVFGTRRVLEFARHHGVRDVLVLSSGAVYGRFPDDVDRAPEMLRCAPNVKLPGAAYGLGKVATEWLANTYGQEYGFACKSARIFAQVGPYLELGVQFAAGNFIRDVLQSQAIVIKGDGTPLRSYMYPTDLVAWLWAILVRGRAGSAYNVGSDQCVSIRELAEAIVRVANSAGAGIQVLGQPTPGAAPDRYVPDIERARTELGLSITVPFENALQRTIEWYRPQIVSQLHD